MPDTATEVRLSTVGDLLACIPAMLGFHPRESLVLICLAPNNGVQLTARVDLPAPDGASRLAAELSRHPAVRAAHRIVAVVVADAAHTTLLDHLDAEMSRLSIPLECYHLPVIAAGALWTRPRSADTGTLPDPTSTVLAAHLAASGNAIHAGRDAIAAAFAPDVDAALTRRAVAIDALLSRPLPTPEQAADVVRAALCDAHRDTLVLADQRVAELAIALSDRKVRDAALATAVAATSELARAAQRLWTCLTRLTPEPERAEPGVLAGYAAYAAGDGATARIALDIARAANPGHTLAGLLLRALDAGAHPRRLASLAQHDPFDLRHALEEEDERPTRSSAEERG